MKTIFSAVASHPSFFTPSPLGSHSTAILHGVAENNEANRLIEGILKEWAEMEDRLLSPDVNDIEYRAMQPTRVVKFRARVKVRGRGRPLPYETDDSEG